MKGGDGVHPAERQPPSQPDSDKIDIADHLKSH
jgi:hypothetical protein